MAAGLKEQEAGRGNRVKTTVCKLQADWADLNTQTRPLASKSYHSSWLSQSRMDGAQITCFHSKLFDWSSFSSSANDLATLKPNDWSHEMAALLAKKSNVTITLCKLTL